MKLTSRFSQGDDLRILSSEGHRPRSDSLLNEKSPKRNEKSPKSVRVGR